MNQPRTETNGRIVRTAPAQATLAPKAGSLEKLITSPQMVAQIQRALPGHLNAQRMARITMTALRTTRGLSECSVPSFLGCVLQAAQLGLEPNTPLQHCWLIPRKSRHTPIPECTLLIGYQGMIELTNRTGMMANPPRAFTVREGDQFEFELGLHPNIIHRPSGDPEREQRPIKFVYAVAKIKGSEDPMFEVLSLAQVNARRERSASPNAGPWATDFEAMAQKSAVRALWKWLPKSADMATAISVESRAERGQASFMPEVATALESADLGLTFPADIPDDQREPEPPEPKRRGPGRPKRSASPIEAKPATPSEVFAEADDEMDPEPPEEVETATDYDQETGEVLDREPGQEG